MKIKGNFNKSYTGEDIYLYTRESTFYDWINTAICRNYYAY